MNKQEIIKEGIVIRLMAADEIMSVDEATDFWGRWKAELEKNPEHFGDCTKQPQTCNRCLIEDYYREADEIMKWEDSQGVAIKVERGTPIVPDAFEEQAYVYLAAQADMLDAHYVATMPIREGK